MLAVLLVVFLGARWAFRPKHVEPSLAEQQPPIEVPAPAPDPSTLLRTPRRQSRHRQHYGDGQTVDLEEFYIRNRLSGENVPRTAHSFAGWLAVPVERLLGARENSPYGNCKLEYITELDKLKKDYGFRAPNHPMAATLAAAPFSTR